MPTRPADGGAAAAAVVEVGTVGAASGVGAMGVLAVVTRSPEVDVTGSAWVHGAADTNDVLSPPITEEVEWLSAGTSVPLAPRGAGGGGLRSGAQPPHIVLGTCAGTSPATAMLANGVGSNGSQTPAACRSSANASLDGAAASGASVRGGGGGDRRPSTGGSGRASDASGLGMRLAQPETASGLQHLLGVPPQRLPAGQSAHGLAAGAAAGVAAAVPSAAAASARASAGASAAAERGPLSKKEMECLFMVGSGEGEEESG